MNWIDFQFRKKNSNLSIFWFLKKNSEYILIGFKDRKGIGLYENSGLDALF